MSRRAASLAARLALAVTAVAALAACSAAGTSEDPAATPLPTQTHAPAQKPADPASAVFTETLGDGTVVLRHPGQPVTDTALLEGSLMVVDGCLVVRAGDVDAVPAFPEDVDVEALVAAGGEVSLVGGYAPLEPELGCGDSDAFVVGAVN